MITAIISKRPAAFAALAAAVILGGAYGFQMAGFPPCELCWYQRYPYMAILVLFPLARLFGAQHSMWLLLVFAGLFELTGWIGFYHAGIEYGFWSGPDGCTGGPDFSGPNADPLAAIMAQPIVRCDEIPWSLFGISMAGYNTLLAMALAIFCFLKSGLLDRLKEAK